MGPRSPGGLALLGLGVCAALAAAAPDRSAQAAGPPRTLPSLPLHCQVAPGPAGPVVRRAWLMAQLASANAAYAPAGMRFELVAHGPLPAGHAVLETRRDRAALGRYWRRGVLNCFVVGRLRDVDDPTQWRRGVHWRSPERPERHWVILSSVGPASTLGHELGHYFGHAGHRPEPGNLMSLDHGPAPQLDAGQRRLVRRGAWEALTVRALLTARLIQRLRR